MSKRIQTRKLALAEGLKTYVGSTCAKHLEGQGLRNTNDGSCVTCGLIKNRAWRAKNPEIYANSQRKWYEANRDNEVERCRKQRINSPEMIAAANRKWGLANPEKVAAKCGRRRATKLQATPDWRVVFFIEEAYALSKLREKLLGGKWHVDHIVPLKSKLVCGLHVEHNLQVIPAQQNISKGNRHWPDMPM